VKAATQPGAGQAHTATPGALPATAPGGPDAQQFARLFAEQAPRVLRVLRRLGVPDGDLDDLCQEVFVVVHQRWHEFRGESSWQTWVYGIAVRKAMGHRRRKHVRDEVALHDGHLGQSAPEQQRDIERAQARAALHAMLAALDDRKREVFVLYELEQLGMKEVAAICQVPLHTAYSRLYAARQELTAMARRIAATEAAK